LKVKKPPKAKNKVSQQSLQSKTKFFYLQGGQHKLSKQKTQKKKQTDLHERVQTRQKTKKNRKMRVGVGV
jgi:hypothetical protein